MLEEDLLSEIASLADTAAVRAFLAKADLTPELRLRLETEWAKRRFPQTPSPAEDDPSLIDSNSIDRSNTILFGTGIGDGVHRPVVAVPPDNSQPITFGRYETRRVLGKGAFGKVYLGYDPQLNRHVAIKVPNLMTGHAESRAQFLLEARQLAALKHPGIVSVYDICVEENQCYIVSDFLEGKSLSDWLNVHQVEWAQAALIVIKIADALAHAHSQRIVHRDLKPANVIMTAGNNPVLVDFGLAISDASTAGLDRGVVAGTPAYMSPEQARGEGHRIDGRTDIYSLGVMMYFMLTRHLPFRSKDIIELLRQVQEDEPQPPRQLNPSIPREVERVCRTAMSRRLRDRYLTASDMADELRLILAQVPTSQSRATPPREAPATIETKFAEEADKFIGPAPTTIPPVVAQSPADSQHDIGHRSSSTRRSSSSIRRVREAERRRVTIVKFSCDVFTSSDVLETLAAEEQEELLQEFQQLCREVTTECGGTIAQLTEDGLRACFGYPIALEDATQRAVHAGLELIERMQSLHDRVRRKHQVGLSAIASVHSDQAIVQDTGEEGSFSIVGSLLNIVGQMDSVAEPNTVIISHDTFELVQRFFDCDSLGRQRFKGGEREVYRVKAERAAGSRVDLTESKSLTPLIGRDREVGLLQERWEQAAEGMGQVVLLIGDAGLGKSRLVHALKEHARRMNSSSPQESEATIIEWRCTVQHQASALYPPMEYFQRILGGDHRQTATERLDGLVDHLATLDLDGSQEIALLASLLSIPLAGHFPALDINPQLQKEKTFELLWDWLRAQAAQKPVLFVLEDLHWLDPTTLELLEQFVAKGSDDRILILLTFRPEFVTPWKSLAHQTQVALNRLTKRQIGEMILAQVGRPVPQRAIDQIAERTDGVPLFVEEFTRTIIESNSHAPAEDASSSASFRTHEIPATLQDLLIARLDRMAIDIEVAQLASAIGREFSYEVMRAVSLLGDTELQAELQKLVVADLLNERGRLPRTKYTFKHALIQDAAYNSLIKKKRQQFHQRIGDALESHFSDTVETQPEILASHYTEAGDLVKAIDYWDKAGTRSLERRAFKEAIRHLRQGLDLLRGQPESNDRFRHEIKMHTALGVPLQATIGYSAPEVEENYARACALCRRLGLTTEMFPVLYGMFRYYMLQAKYVRANELAGQLVTLTEQSTATDFIVAANRAMGSPLVYEGKHRQAIPFLEKVVAIAPSLELRAAVYRYDVVDPWIVARSYMSWAYWLLGQSDVAQRQSDEAVRIAAGLDHSFSLTLALSFSQWIHQFNRDVARTRETADKALSLAQEHGFAFWFGWCRVMRGWAMSQQGEHAKGITEIEEGLVSWRAQGSELGSHYYYGLLAEACLTAGRFEQAAAALDHAEQFASDTGEGFWLAEVARLRGDLLLQVAPADLATPEAKFRQALAIATQQDASALQLRAAFSLAKLLAAQGKSAAARDSLEPICDSFPDGVLSAELDAARCFLSPLSS